MRLPINDAILLLVILAVSILIVGSVIRFVKTEFDYKRWKNGK